MAGLTVWCVRFVQARMVQGPRIGKGPIPDPHRVVEDLGLAQLERMMRDRAVVFLPEPTGAGPCGTLARREWRPRMIDPNKIGPVWNTDERPLMRSLSPLEWSLQHLVPQLQHYYATRPAPGRHGPIGPKHGGGNGRAAVA